MILPNIFCNEKTAFLTPASSLLPDRHIFLN